MLRNFFVTTVGLSLVSIAGCGDPHAGALFIDTQYATRCDMTRGCDMPHQHDFCGFADDPCEGTPEVTVSCSVDEADTQRVISFSARAEGSSISVQNLIVLNGSNAASGGPCRVSIVEGANSYSGACGGSEPSEAQPCRINNIAFVDDMGNPTFSGDIFCQFLPNSASPALQIEVTSNGSRAEDLTNPGHFRFANCSGLTVTP